MDKAVFLALLLGVQVTLLALDIGERVRRRSPRITLPGLSFLAVTVLFYGALQYGGLALVPNPEELVISTRALVERAVGGGSGVPLDGWALVLFGITSFYFTGLCDYLFHRFASHSRLLWFTHENHHLTTDVSVYMPGLFVRPFAVVVVFPTMFVILYSVQLVLGLLDRNGWNLLIALYPVVLVQASVLVLTHSAWFRRRWWLHRMLKPFGIATPQEHWLHHTSDLDCNYGNFTAVWDRVFGTYVDPQTVDLTQHRAGLAYDQDFLGAVTLGKFKLPERLRERFQLEQFCYVDKPSRGS